MRKSNVKLIKQKQGKYKRKSQGEFPVVQWLGLCTFTAGGTSLIPGQKPGSQMPFGLGPPKKKEKEKERERKTGRPV